MSAVISIVVGIITAMVAWALLKNVIAAIFFGILLSALVAWWKSRS